MTFPKHVQANTYRNEHYEQTLQCARAYDESNSWAEFKVKAAAEGIGAKDIMRHFWVHYILHNNADGIVDDRDKFYATMLAFSIGAIGWLAVIGLKMLICYLAGTAMSLTFFLLSIVAAVLVTAITWNILVNYMQYCIRVTDNALSRYKRELEP